MKIRLESVELKMWEATEMPEAMKGVDGKLVKDENGKIKNTGKMIEYTTYTFRDLMGEVFKIMSAKNDFRQLENRTVDVELNLTRREFQGKAETKVSLLSVSESKKK